MTTSGSLAVTVSMLALAGLAASTPVSERPALRTVLLLQSGRSTKPAALLMTEAFRKELEAAFPDPIDLHVEYLALSDAADPYGAVLADFLRQKYARRSIDVVVAIEPPAVEFAKGQGQQALRGVPLVYAEITRTGGRPLARPPNATGISLVLEGQRTVQLALDLHPGTRQVVLVAGAAPQDLVLAQFARELVRARAPDLEVESLAGQPVEKQLDRLAHLPPHSVVVFVDYTADTRGQALVARDVLQRLAAASNAPVYGASETYLGHGIVGGDLIRFGRVAEGAAALAARILKGEPADSIPTVRTPSSELVFDWRELRRWGIPESRLPQGSVVLFREPDLWSEHWKAILSVLALLVGQAFLIGGLLAARSRRASAEAGLRAAEQRYRTVADFTFDWEYWRTPDGRFAYVSPSCLRTTGHSADEFYGRPDLLNELIVPEDRARWAEHSGQALSEEHAAAPLELRIRRADGEVRWIAHVCMPVTAGDGRFLGLRGSNRDVTEKKRSEQGLRQALAEIERLRERLEADNTYLREQLAPGPEFEGIVGRSDALRYVLSKVQQVAATATTVLLQGETGVGKDLFAHAIHSLSPRRARPLVKLNCAAIAPTLVESELFGHEKGAFTGAGAQRKGRFEIADGSTLFLDEIGELPLELQSKLLRVIQDGELERLGGTTTIKVDVRLVAATNRRLEDEVRAGRFRADLWYRLDVFPITVPPLRQRREDVPLLVQHFVEKHCRRLGRPTMQLSVGTLQDLQDHDWPGNVRELESVLERAVISSKGATLQLAERPGRRRAPASGAVAVTTGGADRAKTLTDMERDHIVATLESTRWQIEGVGGAASALDINPGTLRSRMRKLGIVRPGGRAAL